MLTKQDRCDRCSAQAQYRVTKGKFDLLFCGHHYREAWKGLAEQDWLVLDTPTDKLLCNA